jgi:hypothetical protein
VIIGIRSVRREKTAKPTAWPHAQQAFVFFGLRQWLIYRLLMVNTKSNRGLEGLERRNEWVKEEFEPPMGYSP